MNLPPNPHEETSEMQAELLGELREQKVKPLIWASKSDYSGGTRHSRRQQRLNEVTSWMLIFLVLAAPIPMASNRPIFWMLSGAAVALVASLHLFQVSRNRWRLRYRAADHPILLALAVIYFGFLLVQLLPIGGLFSEFEFRFASGSIFSDRLSLTPRASLLALLRSISYGLFFFMMLEVSRNSERARRMAWALFVGMVIHAAWAMLSLHEFQDSFFWGNKEHYIGVATGTFINRNSFATFLGFALVLGISLLSCKKFRAIRRSRGLGAIIGIESIKTYVLYLMVLVVFVTLLSTQSRMGLFATVLSAGLALSLGWPRRAKSDRLFLALSIGVMMTLAAGAIALYGRGLLERLIFVESASASRGALYGQVIEMIRARPFLGYGMDSFQQVFPLFHRDPVNIDLYWDRAHSTYLTLWSELGLVAGSIPLVFCAVVFFGAVRNVLARGRDYDLSLAAMAVIILAAVHSLVDFSLEIQANVLFFLAILALGFSRPRDLDAGSPDVEKA